MLIRADALRIPLAAETVDAIVTDPPYGLAFMGKDWDRGVPGEPFWVEALRVAKSGAHLVAFGGTRTFHRLACAVEDAGWEIRDTVMWVYGSGFPKSLDVSKAIDKRDAAEEQMARRYRFTEWVRSTGVEPRRIDEATGTNMGGHYTTAASQPAIMTRKHLESCRHLMGDVPEWVEREADIRSIESKNFAEREVVGRDTKARSVGGASALPTMGAGVEYKTWDITAPATDAARRWQGWGTALKPAVELIVLARKPLSGTVAENVLRHGTGALNIDGCRVGTGVETWPKSRSYHSARGPKPRAAHGSGDGETISTGDAPAGRWPANLIHDGSDEVVGMFPESKDGVAGKRSGVAHVTLHGLGASDEAWGGYGDSGSAARFFYCAKPSRAERGRGNRHPTVKPLALMSYLCKLVTPPGGLILDPFAGSGTTARAAIAGNFRVVAMDLEYHDIAKTRTTNVQRELLWAGGVS